MNDYLKHLARQVGGSWTFYAWTSITWGVGAVVIALMPMHYNEWARLPATALLAWGSGFSVAASIANRYGRYRQQ